jgi:hypothetical protein
MRTRFAISLYAAAMLGTISACSGDDPISVPGNVPGERQLASIGVACDASHPCENGTVCGSCGIATGQCVLPCSASGSNECPSGSYCSRAGSNRYWTGNYEAHFCVRLCQNDSACATPTGNHGLSCNPAYDDDDGSGPEICNVSNAVGSTHACP